MLEPDILNLGSQLGVQTLFPGGGDGGSFGQVCAWGLACVWSPHQVVDGGERVVGTQ